MMQSRTQGKSITTDSDAKGVNYDLTQHFFAAEADPQGALAK